MEQGEAFASGANQVTFCKWKNHAAVCKEYKEQLKDYPVRWPVSREVVEASILRKMGNLEEKKKRQAKCYIHFPKIYREEKQKHILWLEYCGGRPLTEWRSEQLQEESVWQDFFQFLYGLKDIDQENVEHFTKGTIQGQRPIWNCMRHWKLKDQKMPDFWEPSCLVLGDVSVNNILFDGKRLTLIDFECAHWGYEGYDVGQFLGMAYARWKKSKFPEFLERVLRNSISDDAWIQKCMYWKQLFINYYDSQRF